MHRHYEHVAAVSADCVIIQGKGLTLNFTPINFYPGHSTAAPTLLLDPHARKLAQGHDKEDL